MTGRQPDEDAVVAAADVAMIRQVPGACADLIARAEENRGPQFGWAAGDAADILDFASPARRAR